MAYGSLPFVIPCLQPFTGEGREAAAVFTKPMPHSSEGGVGTSGTLLAGELVQQQRMDRPTYICVHVRYSCTATMVLYGIRNEVSFVIPSLQPSHKKKKEAAATQLLAPTVLSCAELCSAVLCWVLWARPRRTGVRYGIILFPACNLCTRKRKEGGC